jgi:hypothetical protein
MAKPANIGGGLCPAFSYSAAGGSGRDRIDRSPPPISHPAAAIFVV